MAVLENIIVNDSDIEINGKVDCNVITNLSQYYHQHDDRSFHSSFLFLAFKARCPLEGVTTRQGFCLS